jgi:3-methylcrotonyl-CoA carboxylase alpha subunit
MWLSAGDERWPLRIEAPHGAGAADADSFDLTIADRRCTLQVYRTGERFSVFAPAGSASVALIDPAVPSGDGAHAAGGLAAPMPGKVIAFLAKAGDLVTQGQPLAVMEAMKMEHTIAAPRDGRIEELLYAVGDQVDEGGALLRLAPAT